MAPFDYPPTPTPLVPDGLQCVYPSSPEPYMYTLPGYDYTHWPQNARDFVHARFLCDQRYADLQGFQARMADLERRQCRCGGSTTSTWCRTKRCVVDSLKKLKERAQSLGSRRKPQDTSELKHGGEFKWPSEPERPSKPERHSKSRPSLHVKELMGDRPWAELQDSIAELGDTPLTAHHMHPNGSSVPASQANSYPSHPDPHLQSFEHAKAAYGHDAGAVSFCQVAHQPHAQISRVHEPDMTMPSYPGPPVTHFRNIPPLMSPLGPPAISTLENHSFVSPLSSVSSLRTVFTGVTPVGVPGAPLFAAHTTASPVESDWGSDVTPSWNRHPSTAHQNSWDSTTTAAELPGHSLSYEVPGAAPWLQEPSGRSASELEGTMPLAQPSMPPLPQVPGAIWPMVPLVMPASGANAQLELDLDRWQTSAMMSMEDHPMMDEPTRHHSYSSTADTVLDLRVLDDDENGQKDPEDPEAVKPFYSPPSHPVSEHPYQQGVTEHVPSPPTFGSPSSPRLSEFPRQQSIAKNDPPSPLKKRKARQQHQQQQQQQQEPVGCQPCNFFPKAAGQRRKMDKHNRTNKHRKRTGQDVGACEPFPCLICKTKFSREDNLFQHLRKAHGVQQHQGGKKLAWKEVGRSLALSGALAGQGEGGWF